MAGRKRGRPRREAREWRIEAATVAESNPGGELEAEAQAGMKALVTLMRAEMDAIFLPGVNVAWMERGLLAAMLFGGKQVTVCLDD